MRKCLAGWAGMSLRDSPWGCPVDGSGADGAPSGWQGNGAQSGQGATWVSHSAGEDAGSACGVGEAPAMEKKRRRRVLVVTSLPQTDARCPAGQVPEGRPRRRWRRNGLTGDG